ncbi:MAG: tRNA glutamyl-Q(34) synthetase GluQRS [Burkholderiales bacterium]
MHSSPLYRGRFAPSPTGPLHFGSLVAAAGSYLDARANNGEWLVRMEDLDTLRTAPGAADDILRTLQAFGFEWDGKVVYQSARAELYQGALEKLREQKLIYPCACSRKEIADSSIVGIDGLVYPGTCRAGIRDRNKTARTWRVYTQENINIFNDLICGGISQNIAKEIGDFVVWRVHGLASYQLAVVVDDAAQGITHVVRGADLLASTARQIYLQQLLHLPTPQYLHLPVAANERGEKWSKQTLATALNSREPLPSLRAALDFLGQPSTEVLTLTELWQFAIANWARDKIPHHLNPSKNNSINEPNK